MSGKNTKTLSEVCELIVDCLHNTAQTEETGYPLVRTPNIGKGRLLFDGIYRVSEDTYRTWTKRAVPIPGDLILAREASAGNVAIIKEGEPVCLGQRTVHIRPDRKQVDPDYLCYFLLAPKQQGRLLAGETGATSKHVNMSDIRKLALEGLPDLPIQKAIGAIVATYDDLIDNNRRRIQLLEQASRLLYKEWFGRLRFPGHEHVKIKEGVPDGWEKTIVGLCTSFLGRGISPNYDDEASGIVINQRCIRNGMIDMEPSRHQSREVPPNKIVRFGDVLVNSTGEGTLGRIAQVRIELEKCTVDSHVTIARPANWIPIHYFGLSLRVMETLISTLGRGATNQTELARDTIAQLPIVLPSAALADAFEETVAPISRQMCVLAEKNTKLRAARDLLLPKLMNGEIAV